MKRENKQKTILLSWLDVKNDPYMRIQSFGDYYTPDDEYILGPTLNILFDKDSPYYNKIDKAFLFHRIPPEKYCEDHNKSMDVLHQTLNEVNLVAEKHKAKIDIETAIWNGSDPTSHQDIFQFIEKQIRLIRKQHYSDELIIHISPGTPSMHTIWVLMATTGYINPPFKIVQAYRKGIKGDTFIVKEVKLDIETFYKVYQKSRPKPLVHEEERAYLDITRLKSSKMTELYKEAGSFAKLKVPVLILGERGVGKTILANWIRANSPYRKKSLDKNWPALACGQFINSQLLQSELFGYKKGSFTGAAADKVGLIKTADGDTLFLDEIGDIDRQVQRFLIKAIEEKSFIPLGSNNIEKSDFRLIAATNRSYEELQERLDPDFLDRISIFTLKIPCLREIPEDIPFFWNMVLSDAISKSGLNINKSEIENLIDSKMLINILQSSTLPGNWRDIYKIAYRLIAIINDKNRSYKESEILDYAIKGIDDTTGSSDIEKQLAMVAQIAIKYYAKNQLFCNQANKFSPGVIIKLLQNKLAIEIKKYAKIEDKTIDEICDKSERSLYNWIKD